MITQLELDELTDSFSDSFQGSGLNNVSALVGDSSAGLVGIPLVVEPSPHP